MNNETVVAKFEIKFEDDLTENDISYILSTGLSGSCGFSSVRNPKEEYAKAKEELEADLKPNDEIYHEDVQARVLIDGGTIKLQDPEDGHWGELTLKNLIEGLQKYFKEGWSGGFKTMHDLVENSDFDDCDCILQAAVWGDVIYG